MKEFKRVMTVQLSDPEVLNAAREIAAQIRQLERLKFEKKANAKNYDGMIASVEEEIGSLRDKITTGKWETEVTCVEAPNYDTREMLVIRTDTDEVIDRRPMSSAEAQTDICEVEGAQEDETAQEPEAPATTETIPIEVGEVVVCEDPYQGQIVRYDENLSGVDCRRATEEEVAILEKCESVRQIYAVDTQIQAKDDDGDLQEDFVSEPAMATISGVYVTTMSLGQINIDQIVKVLAQPPDKRKQALRR